MKNVFIKDVDHLDHGDRVVLNGWAQEVRMMKNIAFIILRDSSGLIQTTVKKENEFFPKLQEITRESVLEITGTVPDKVMSKLGREVIVESLKIMFQTRLLTAGIATPLIIEIYIRIIKIMKFLDPTSYLLGIIDILNRTCF